MGVSLLLFFAFGPSVYLDAVIDTFHGEGVIPRYRISPSTPSTTILAQPGSYGGDPAGERDPPHGVFIHRDIWSNENNVS